MKSLLAIFAVLLSAFAGLDARADQLDLALARAKVAADEARRTEVFAKAAKSTVCIFANPDRRGGGTGVIISPDGYGLTNFHVVQEFVEARRGVGGLSDGKLYPLRLLGIDPGGDVAMFKLEGREPFEFAPLADSDQLRVGQWVAAMGNPFLLAEDYSPTVTLGVISGLHRYQEGQNNILEYADCIQVSTSINPGNSGGPLFDLDGRVVGINGRISAEERGRVNVGLGYAITINQIKRFMPGLRSGRLVEHGTLGATVQQNESELIVSAIQDISPAEQAGVQLGDAIISVHGRRVRTSNEFNNAVALLPADWPVEIVYRRDGRELRGRARTERLAIKAPFVFLPDVELNLEQVRAAWKRLDASRGTSALADATKVSISGIVRAKSIRGEAVFPFSASVDRAGIVDVTMFDGKEPATGQTTSGDAHKATTADLARLVAACAGVREIGVGWDLVGGDEIDGRIVGVVQHKAEAGPRLRWKFAEDSGDLLAASAVDDEARESASWRPLEWREVDGARLPMRWQRTAGENDELTLEISKVIASTSQPSGTSRPTSTGGGK
ncbi:MAG: S1C family serine protease [Phycisphaerae bacterium]